MATELSKLEIEAAAKNEIKIRFMLMEQLASSTDEITTARLLISQYNKIYKTTVDWHVASQVLNKMEIQGYMKVVGYQQDGMCRYRRTI